MKPFLVAAGFALMAAPLSPAMAQDGQTSAAANQIAATQSLNDWRSGFDRRRMGVGTYLDLVQTNYLESRNPRRVRRAETAAALVNAGDCRGAKAVAAGDNDRRLLARLDDVCGRGDILAAVD
ncbi:hypothetical protein [Brevundimonas sp. TWP2-3-2]|uniref:hypothetical protein n=1 Tax=unclassified Brevundimonas TaxID=2622653 RepID=UPI003CF853AA